MGRIRSFFQWFDWAQVYQPDQHSLLVILNHWHRGTVLDCLIFLKFFKQFFKYAKKMPCSLSVKATKPYITYKISSSQTDQHRDRRDNIQSVSKVTANNHATFPIQMYVNDIADLCLLLRYPVVHNFCARNLSIAFHSTRHHSFK